MKKKIYEKPVSSFIAFETTDIMSSSGGLLTVAEFNTDNENSYSMDDGPWQ